MAKLNVFDIWGDERSRAEKHPYLKQRLRDFEVMTAHNPHSFTICITAAVLNPHRCRSMIKTIFVSPYLTDGIKSMPFSEGCANVALATSCPFIFHVPISPLKNCANFIALITLCLVNLHWRN